MSGSRRAYISKVSYSKASFCHSIHPSQKMHYIHVHNKSQHDQEFEVHGYHDNKNLIVKAGQMATIEAPDKTSGAIIALHDGHEGEQAEITKDGWGGNDTFDISVIVGAGGNMTIQQIGDASTRKGDPTFMQNLREAWKKADAKKKEELKGVVHLDKSGVPVRIDAPKRNKALEAFVRTFAENKVYIGIGAWGNSKGDAGDNAQSSAAHGNKDLVLTYSDGDATPDEHAPQLAHRIQGTAVANVKAVAASTEAPSGPGIVLSNKGQKEDKYFFYPNYWNGNGTAGANFDKPSTSVSLKPGETHFVSLPPSFKGRVQRGTFQPATWAEFQLSADNDHGAHGDISLEQGCDGAATIASTDGSKVEGGFTERDIVEKAPAAAKQKRQDGVECIASTMGNWMGGPNHAAIEYLNKAVGQKKAYITGGTGTPDIASKNQRLAVTFY
ncbi:hypothetical protein C8R45DRAFT_1000581 [Mycena sanguinolenta]|nr:hypothetical protein C8R45DRAFT_1000581 [Mycena sanguinolenta]